MGYYANAIALIKSICLILPQYELRHQEEIDLPQRVEQIKSVLFKLNNGYLERGKNFLTNKHLLLPYFVDRKLKKKTVQPDYVKNGQVFVHQTKKDNNMKAEWRFVQVCKNGKWQRKSFDVNFNLQCRFLHHKDSYLKLGPFKEDFISLRPYIVVFRDVLLENDIQNLIKSSIPALSRELLHCRWYLGYQSCFCSHVNRAI